MKKTAKLFVIFILIMQSTIYLDGPRMVRANKVEGDFQYRLINEREIEIMAYTGDGGAVVIPEQIAGMDITVIGEHAFSGKGITDVQLPLTLREVGERAFYNNELKSVALPSGLEIIGNEAFANNAALDLNQTSQNIVGQGNDLDTTVSVDVPEENDMDMDEEIEQPELEEVRESATNLNEKKTSGDEMEGEDFSAKGLSNDDTASVVESIYVMAQDSDFSGDSDGEFQYIGSDEYVEIPHTIKGVNVTSYEHMFSNTHVKGVKSTNQNVKNMSNMFSYSRSTTLDLSTFDTGNVKNMSNMFSYSRAKELDLSSFDTGNVENMSSMFYDSWTTTLDVSSFDTSNVEDMRFMFFYSQATTLDLGNFDTSSAKNMRGMFYESRITTLDLSSFDTSNVKNMGNMFTNSRATTLDVSSFDTSNVEDMGSMFSGSLATTLDLSSFDTSNVENMENMFYYSQATTLDVSSFDTSKVANMSYMFNGSKATTLDVSSFDTGNVENMRYMFYDSWATTLDLSTFDTGNVKNMGSMFSGSRATTLDVSSFDTSNVENMIYMFYDSWATTLDLNSFDTSNIGDMSYMFFNSRAKKLDLSSFDTGNVKNMRYMFSGSWATTLDLSSFATSNVRNMESMFSNNLATTLDVSTFDTSNVWSMESMFSSSRATTLDVSSFDTSNVTKMSNMFSGSHAVTLDLSTFDTSNVWNMESMFSNSYAATLYLSSFDTSNVRNMSNMFGKSWATRGYAGTQEEANKFNNSSFKPEHLTFNVMDLEGYILAIDSDFSGDSDGDFRYIGSDEYVEIPHTIKGVNVTSYENMFSGTDVKGVKSTNQNVKNMSNMFYQSQADTLYLRTFDTSSVENMSGLFYESKAATLDLSTFDTSNVVNMSGMFSSSHADILDLRTFDMSSVKNVSGIFDESQATRGYARTQVEADWFNNISGKPEHLTFRVMDPDGYILAIDSEFSGDSDGEFQYIGSDEYVEVPHTIKGVDVTSYWNMFSSTDVKGVKSTNQHVKDMRYMFSNSRATTLDLSGFDTSNVWSMDYMFSDSQATRGYVRTQEEANKFNNSSGKPEQLFFLVRGTPIFQFNGNGNFNYKKKQEVNVSVDLQGMDLTSLKYQWTTDKTFPTSGQWTDFTNDSTVTVGDGTGDYYLHVEATSDQNITTRETSNIFKLDNKAPILSLFPSTTSHINGDISIVVKATDEHSGVKRIREINGDWENGDEMTFTASENGTYTFEAEDVAGNTILETIEISNIDREAPVLTLLGDKIIELAYGDIYEEPGFDVVDNLDNNIKDKVEVTGEVDTKKIGIYEIVYSVIDDAGNRTIRKRTVHVVDKEKPVITLIGDGVMTLELGDEYKELGANGFDDVNGDITDLIDITGKVDTTKQGIYTIHYNLTDEAGNQANEVIREVHIVSPKVIFIERDAFAIEVYASSTIKVRNTNTKIQLPSDLPEGTLLQVKSVQNMPLTGYELVGEMYAFIFTFPDGEKYNGDFILTLGVDKAVENLAIYYFNEVTQAWQFIGGEITNEGITVSVNHFSVYGVLGEITEAPDIEPNPDPDLELEIDLDLETESDSDVKKGLNDHEIKDEGKMADSLPTTATNRYKILFTGFLFIVIGAMNWYFWKRREIARH